jgi:putative methylase
VDIVYYAGFEFNDIKNRLIFDLGSGTGRLSIACSFFKANNVISVDVDWNALKILKRNIKKFDLDHLILPICADVAYIEFSKSIFKKNMKITTIMNPPFGVKTKSADRPFLEKAFSFSDVVYSIHLANEKVKKFILSYVKQFNWKVDNILPYDMILERSFKFHTHKAKEIKVYVFRFLKK